MTLSRLYQWVYAHDSRRRANSHRCRCCWKVIEEGQPVLALRLNKTTWMLHDECKEKQHTPESTWVEAFTEWSKA